MKNFISRNLLLLVATAFFLCIPDHFIALLLPYTPKLVGKAMGKAVKIVSEIDRIVRRI